MKAGPLDRRITLQRATTTTNSLNEPVKTWADIATVWAAKLEVRDSERQRAAETAAVIDTRFQIRWSSTVSDVDAADRVVFGGRVFNIVGVKEIGRREGLELSCQARSETP